MSSATQKTEFCRKRRHNRAGKDRKHALQNHGTTPVFPVHTAEADANQPAEARPTQD